MRCISNQAASPYLVQSISLVLFPFSTILILLIQSEILCQTENEPLSPALPCILVSEVARVGTSHRDALKHSAPVFLRHLKKRAPDALKSLGCFPGVRSGSLLHTFHVSDRPDTLIVYRARQYVILLPYRLILFQVGTLLSVRPFDRMILRKEQTVNTACGFRDFTARIDQYSESFLLLSALYYLLFERCFTKLYSIRAECLHHIVYSYELFRRYFLSRRHLGAPEHVFDFTTYS